MPVEETGTKRGGGKRNNGHRRDRRHGGSGGISTEGQAAAIDERSTSKIGDADVGALGDNASAEGSSFDLSQLDAALIDAAIEKTATISANAVETLTPTRNSSEKIVTEERIMLLVTQLLDLQLDHRSKDSLIARLYAALRQCITKLRSQDGESNIADASMCVLRSLIVVHQLPSKNHQLQDLHAAAATAQSHIRPAKPENFEQILVREKRVLKSTQVEILALFLMFLFLSLLLKLGNKRV